MEGCVCVCVCVCVCLSVCLCVCVSVFACLHGEMWARKMTVFEAQHPVSIFFVVGSRAFGFVGLLSIYLYCFTHLDSLERGVGDPDSSANTGNTFYIGLQFI